MSTPTLEFKSALLAAPEAAEQVIAEAERVVAGVEAFEGEGIVTAIVSVTGVIDEVDDIILPGAYFETLRKRMPKVCWHHSWEHPIGKVLQIEELLPGDPRLPAKTRDGQPWPAEAGALVAKMQMNMESERGREAYSAIVFYSKSGECEYSIGYKVPVGKATKDSKGVRRIKALDLFELSFVLFGAHTMTGTLSLKAAVSVMREAKASGGTFKISKKAIDEEFERLMADVDLDVDEDADVDEPEGAEPTAVGDDLQAVLDLEDDEEDEIAELHAKALAEDHDTDITATCTCGDEVGFDTMNGWMGPDGSYSHDDNTTHSDHLPVPAEFKAEGGADQNRGNAENLRRSYVSGKISVEIGWGTDGDFARCVAIASEHMTAEQAKGYCNLRHQDAVGAPPGKGHGEGKAATQPETTAPDKDAPNGPDSPKHTGVMVALYPSPEAAKDIVVRGGEDAEELHVTLAFLGDMTDQVGDGLTLEGATSQIVAACQAVAATHQPLSGTVGGLGKFPDTGSGVPVWAPVDVVGLSALRESVVEALVDAGIPVKTDHGFTPHMTLGYNLDMALVQPVDNVPVEFTHLVIAVGGTHTRVAIGDDLGAEGSGAALPGTPTQEAQTAGQNQNLAKAYDPTIETGPEAGHVDPLARRTEQKSFPRLAGSLEELTQALDGALCGALFGNLDDESRKERYLSIDGTWPDRVICTVHHWAIPSGHNETQAYEFPYTVATDGSISLGEPTPVTLSVTAVVDREELNDVPVGDLLPHIDLIEAVTNGMKSIGLPEQKAGRVLSASIAARLRYATEHLIVVLQAGGIEITVPGANDLPPAAVDGETTAPQGKAAFVIPTEAEELLAEIEALTT